jgi:hypothetical protein
MTVDDPHSKNDPHMKVASAGEPATRQDGSTTRYDGSAARHDEPTARHDKPTTRHDISTVLAREPCAGCGAPLGADQRYCLSCGIPRSGTRLPFLDVLHAEAASAGIVEQGSQPASLLRVPALAAASSGNAGNGAWGAGGRASGGMGARLRENTGLFALTGVLLLAMLIGLLLGHWVSGASKSSAALPAKQVVEIKGLPAAAPVASAPSSAAAGQGAGTGTSKSSSAAPATTTPASASTPAATPHATNPTVSTLATSTGKEHAKAVEQALSKGGGSLSTGGAPPPKETSKPGASSKPIGGGSEVTSIE